MNDIQNIQERLIILSARLGWGFLNMWKNNPSKYNVFVRICLDMLNEGKSEKAIEKYFLKQHNFNDYEVAFLIDDANKMKNNIPLSNNKETNEVQDEEQARVQDDNPVDNVYKLKKFDVPEMSEDVHKEFKDFNFENEKLKEINSRPYDYENKWSDMVSTHDLKIGDVIIGTRNGDIDACEVTHILSNGEVYIKDYKDHEMKFNSREVKRLRKVKEDKVKNIYSNLINLNG